MTKVFSKKYRPGAYVPSTSFTGEEAPLIFRGENMWIRYGRFGSVYAEGYSGNKDLSEIISQVNITGTLSWTAGSTTITGLASKFQDELSLGQFIVSENGTGYSELFVVEEIVSSLEFTASRAPTTSASGATAYGLPIIFPIGTKRGTAARGIVLQYPKGHYLGVGDGTLAINGSTTLGSGGTFSLSKKPQFALYDKNTNTYSTEDVGIDPPIGDSFSLTAVAGGTTNINSSTNANPIVIATATDHGLSTGQTISISGHLINTNANGNWTITKLTDTTFSLNGSTGNGVGGASGIITAKDSLMQAGAYNIRICNANSTTKGFSQPSDAIAPVTLTANQWIKITFNNAMLSDQDSYDIYGTQFLDNSTTTIEARYMGPWYKVATVTAEQLKDSTHPTGREAGTSIRIAYLDAEIANAPQILTFNNFLPVNAEYVDIINGIPIYFSCLGKETSTEDNKSPGPVAIPSKPSNSEAVFLDKAITTAGADYILGEFNAKSRIYVLCQNSLQVLILTSIDEAPITFRSLWNSGFRNPYNVAFVKEYLYGFSTQGIVRSVAGGDDTAMEFEFASDVRSYTQNWEVGHVLVGNDPKNRAVVYFYSAAEKRNGYWVTIALPWLLDKQVWSTPIVIEAPDRDMIVSGVATVGSELVFIAGGKTSTGYESKTYVFDGGDSYTKNWYLAWAYSDDGQHVEAKTLKGELIVGKLADSNSSVKIYGVRPNGTFNFSDLEDGSSPDGTVVLGSTTDLARKRLRLADWGVFSLYSIRVDGSYTTEPDRLDVVTVGVEVNSSAG